MTHTTMCCSAVRNEVYRVSYDWDNKGRTIPCDVEALIHSLCLHVDAPAAQRAMVRYRLKQRAQELATRAEEDAAKFDGPRQVLEAGARAFTSAVGGLGGGAIGPSHRHMPTLHTRTLTHAHVLGRTRSCVVVVRRRDAHRRCRGGCRRRCRGSGGGGRRQRCLLWFAACHCRGNGPCALTNAVFLAPPLSLQGLSRRHICALVPAAALWVRHGLVECLNAGIGPHVPLLQRRR